MTSSVRARSVGAGRTVPGNRQGRSVPQPGQVDVWVGPRTIAITGSLSEASPSLEIPVMSGLLFTTAAKGEVEETAPYRSCLPDAKSWPGSARGDAVRPRLFNGRVRGLQSQTHPRRGYIAGANKIGRAHV